MRELSMFCKIKNFVTVSALALIVSATNYANAQGLVTLSEEAMFDETEAPKEKETPKPELNSDGGDDALGNIAPKAATPAPIAEKTTPEVPVQSLKQDAKESAKYPSVNPEEIPSFEDIVTEEENLVDSEVFQKMSDIEKQTALLNLELRKERVRNEIEALKNQRRQAEQQEKDAEEEKIRKQKEWEKEQERKILEEQQKLRELDIQFEKYRQERLLNSYKNEMLKANQEWIAHESGLYKQINDLKAEKQALLNEMKNKLQKIKSNASSIPAKAKELVDAYKKELENKDVQISVLRARNEAQERELEKKNPFAEGAAEATATAGLQATTPAEVEVEELKLINLYAVMEIRGQNGELIAKLINKDGMPFYVKKGTMLQSGHTISEITSTYVKAEKDGTADYLYFAAGGILPKEQPSNTIKQKISEENKDDNSSGGTTSFVASTGVPGMGKSMMAR